MCVLHIACHRWFSGHSGWAASTIVVSVVEEIFMWLSVSLVLFLFAVAVVVVVVFFVSCLRCT